MNATIVNSHATRISRPPDALIAPAAPLPWVRAATNAPYFLTEHGGSWTPVGQNDAMSWPELAPLFRRRDLRAVEAHLQWLRASGVSVLRLMLECAHRRHRYLESPTGRFVPNVVRFWDDLFALCAKYELRLLLAPYDTFWTWKRWRQHPLSRTQGGPCSRPGNMLRCPATRRAIKNRFTFAIERWGGSGALFAWDLWNEIHPAHAGDRPDCVDVFNEFIADLSEHVRTLESRLYGRTHLQTVSLFGPELERRPHLALAEPIFRHPSLDFATTHLYREGTIDTPRDTVAPALDIARLVRGALAQICDGRPYLDTEHGPIHTFKDHRITLPEPFDDEYFRHIQWAHLASGGAGGGMRWPNRHPHTLTHGMRVAQHALAEFLPLIDWTRFRRRNLNEEVDRSTDRVAVCACADAEQAVVWLLRTDTIGADGMLRADADPVAARLRVPSLADGRYRITVWDTRAGRAAAEWEGDAGSGAGLTLDVGALRTDLALAIRRL